MLLQLADIPDMLASTILPLLSPRDQAALSETCSTLQSQTRDFLHRKIKCRSCNGLLLSTRSIPSSCSLHLVHALSTYPAMDLQKLHTSAIPGLVLLEFPMARFYGWETEVSLENISKRLRVSRLCYLIGDHPVHEMQLIPMDCGSCGNLVAYLCASVGIRPRLFGDINKYCRNEEGEVGDVMYSCLQFSRAGTVVVDHWDVPCWRS